MKILIISAFFPPQNSVASLRPYSWAKYWSKLGHKVTVLTTIKDITDQDLNYDVSEFETIEVAIPYRKRRYQSGESNSAKPSKKKKGLKSYLSSRGVNNCTRMPDFTDLWVGPAYKKIENKKWDLVVSTFGPYSSHLIGLKIKTKSPETKWIVDYRDMWTENHIFKGVFPFTMIEKYLEKKINSKADFVTTVSEPLARVISENGLSNVYTIENGFDSEEIDNISNSEYFDSDDKVRIAYTGSIYQGKRDPSPLFQAIKELKSENPRVVEYIEVIFVGPNVDLLEEMVSFYEVESNVKLLGMINREDSLRMQRDSDILLFLEYEEPNMDGILTGKLFEYLYSGNPVWAVGITSNYLSGKMIEESNGIAFGTDVGRIKKELGKFDKKKSQSVGVENVKRFERNILAERMLNLATE